MASIKSLNPFFIRSAVEMYPDADIDPEGWVLIPSSSGLRLKLMRSGETDTSTRLNPFFIRSAVEIYMTENREMLWGLNPFFIRSAVEIANPVTFRTFHKS